jgi:hypothetical protein
VGATGTNAEIPEANVGVSYGEPGFFGSGKITHIDPEYLRAAQAAANFRWTDPFGMGGDYTVAGRGSIDDPLGTRVSGRVDIPVSKNVDVTAGVRGALGEGVTGVNVGGSWRPTDRSEFSLDLAKSAQDASAMLRGTIDLSDLTLYAKGGLASLPQNPVLGGQEHMLAYITPEEASTLRAQGGGVTPDGGQRRGPGGIASFGVGKGYSGATFSGAMGQTPGGKGPGGHGKFGLGDTAADTDFSLSVAETFSKGEEAADKLSKTDLPNLHALQSKTNPKSIKGQEVAQAISKGKKGLADSGFVSGAISKLNALKSAISQDNEGFYGKHMGWIDAKGNEVSIADFAAMSPAETQGLLGDPGTSTKLDPKSPFASVLGLAQFGLGFAVPTAPFSALGYFGDVANMLSGEPLSGIPGMLSSLATSASDAVDLPEFSFADVFGKDADQAISDTVQQAVAPVHSAAQDIYGFVAPPVHDMAAALGLHSEPSPFSITPANMGPGIEQPQAGPWQPPPVVIDHTGPLGTEVQDPLGGDVYESGLISPAFTIDELQQYGIGQIPQTTSMFAAHGGFVDKPLYSRS